MFASKSEEVLINITLFFFKKGKYYYTYFLMKTRLRTESENVCENYVVEASLEEENEKKSELSVQFKTTRQ